MTLSIYRLLHPKRARKTINKPYRKQRDSERRSLLVPNSVCAYVHKHEMQQRESSQTAARGATSNRERPTVRTRGGLGVPTTSFGLIEGSVHVGMKRRIFPTIDVAGGEIGKSPCVQPVAVSAAAASIPTLCSTRSVPLPTRRHVGARKRELRGFPSCGILPYCTWHSAEEFRTYQS